LRSGEVARKLRNAPIRFGAFFKGDTTMAKKPEAKPKEAPKPKDKAGEKAPAKKAGKK